MIQCISQVTTLPASFADDLANAAAAGFPAAEIWLTKLEQQLENSSIEETEQLIAGSGLRLAAAAYQGGLLTPGPKRSTHLEHFKKRLELCQSFRIPVLIVTGDFKENVDAGAIAHAAKGLVEAARWAAGFGVRLALEFHGSDSFANNLDTAVTFVEQCGEPNIGICLDLFHYYKGPSRREDLERLTRANLFHAQVCDVAGIPRELMTDSDRVLPGDGDFRLRPIITQLREMGYAGAVSMELMNPALWQIDAKQVAHAAKQSLDRLLGSG